MKRLLLIPLVGGSLFLAACGISREAAGEKANAFCQGHGGVARFWYATERSHHKHAYEVTCNDGEFEAKEE